MKRCVFSVAMSALWISLLSAPMTHAQEPVRHVAPDEVIPPGNNPNLSAEPPRPPLGDATARAAQLFEAIRTDNPTLAHDFFLPQAAFAQVKGISDPDALWQRIFAAYDGDVHELHAALLAMPGGATAEFVRIRVTGHRAWVRVREESNRLPYWAQRHSFLVFRINGREREFEIRTMIAWDNRWYITHLSEFRQAQNAGANDTAGVPARSARPRP